MSRSRPRCCSAPRVSTSMESVATIGDDPRAGCRALLKTARSRWRSPAARPARGDGRRVHFGGLAGGNRRSSADVHPRVGARLRLVRRAAGGQAGGGQWPGQRARGDREVRDHSPATRSPRPVWACPRGWRPPAPRWSGCRGVAEQTVGTAAARRSDSACRYPVGVAPASTGSRVPISRGTAARRPSAPSWGGRVLDRLGGLGVLHRQPGAPLEVADDRLLQLPGCGQSSSVVRLASWRRNRCRCAAVMANPGGGGAAVPLRVRLRSAEHLGPPVRDVGSMMLRDPAGKEAGQDIVGFDPVVEAVDHPSQRNQTARPLVQRRQLPSGSSTSPMARVHLTSRMPWPQAAA